IDFGTSTIKIYKKGQGIILLERNVVSTVGKEKRPIAIGEDAYEMYEKQPPSIHVSFPLHHGVIAHLQDMIALWNFMNENVTGKKKQKHQEYYIAVPADITEVEKQAYSQIVTDGDSKPRKVCLIDKPVAAIYGMGMDLERIQGACIVDMGADTTELTILSQGGIVVTKLLPYGGNYFDTTIRDYLRKQYNFMIGNRTAEQVKKAVISAVPSERSYQASGRNVLRGLPDEIEIHSQEILPLTKGVFVQIATAIQSVIEHIPPEISTEIKQDGIYLTGGSSQITGIDHLIQEIAGVRVNLVSKPQETVVQGLGYLAEHPKLAARYAVTIR
ncbi:MAG: rod shape-determining protein, partial [Lachnospiraceae bacterium]|nr:rod shape-determining protein [Lachnospiraceae bacterium]